MCDPGFGEVPEWSNGLAWEMSPQATQMCSFVQAAFTLVKKGQTEHFESVKKGQTEHFESSVRC